MQAKLLRVVEDGKVTPEGADRHEAQVDVGLIAATNRDLVAMVRKGLFRDDLYHRLATLRVHVPPLRDRKGDIRTIVEQRLETLSAEGHPYKLSRKAWVLLTEYDWPGNVRQLIKLVDRAVLLDMRIDEALDEERELGEVREGEGGEKPDFLPRDRRDVKAMAEVQREYAHRAWHLYDRNYSRHGEGVGCGGEHATIQLLEMNSNQSVGLGLSEVRALHGRRPSVGANCAVGRARGSRARTDEPSQVLFRCGKESDGN